MRFAIRNIIIGVSTFFLSSDGMFSQTFPDTFHVSGEVSGLKYGEALAETDSLEIRMLDLQIEQATIEERRASFWYRLIPAITVSANLGIDKLVFVDPSTFGQYILPRDAYRLTFTLSLSDVLNFDKHTSGQIHREKLEQQRQITVRNLQREKEKAIHTQYQLNCDLAALRQEEELINELLRYTELLFNQGEVKFDELVKVRLQQLHVRHSLLRGMYSNPIVISPDSK